MEPGHLNPCMKNKGKDLRLFNLIVCATGPGKVLSTTASTDWPLHNMLQCSKAVISSEAVWENWRSISDDEDDSDSETTIQWIPRVQLQCGH